MPSLLGSLLLALTPLIFGVVAPFLFAWANRRVGGDLPHPKSRGYGAVALYSLIALLLSLVFHVHKLWFIGTMGLVWWAYRCLPWKIGGSLTPRTELEKIESFLRHSLPALVVLAWAYGHVTAPYLALPFFAFAAFATSRDINYAQAVDATQDPSTLPNINARKETNIGRVYGLAMLVIAAIPSS